MSDLITPALIFVATFLGGVCVYEYSAWRTQGKIKKYASLYHLEDVIKILKELKEALL